MIVSREDSSKFQKRCFQNERFARRFFQISKKEASKMIVSHEASSKFQRRSFQKDRFARGFLQISKKKLPKWSFRARLPPNFKKEAFKMIVSHEASTKFQGRSFQNDRFVRGFLQILKKKLPKWSFRTRLPLNSKGEASKRIVLREVSSKFQKRSFQNDRFVRGFLQISEKKLSKWSFCARLPPNFKEEASKMIVLREASSKFQRRSFQNDRFVRGFFQILKKKLPKWSFRTRLPPNFEKEASKMIVSHEASFKFQRRSFQKDRFARGFLQISKKKLPKWSFRARLPPNFRKEAFKMIVLCEASSKFQRRSFQNDRFARGFFQISKKKLPKWSFRARLLPNFKKEASKMIVSHEASSKFWKRSFQNDRFARGFL